MRFGFSSLNRTVYKIIIGGPSADLRLKLPVAKEQWPMFLTRKTHTKVALSYSNCKLT